jgi:hypothetical protein
VQALTGNQFPAWRQRFRSQNSILGAKWDDHNRLLNPDEIWPADWEHTMCLVVKDFKDFEVLYTRLNAKRLYDLRGTAVIDGLGDPSMLVFLPVENIKHFTKL